MGLGFGIAVGIIVYLLLCQEAHRRLIVVPDQDNGNDKILNITESEYPAIFGCVQNSVCSDMLQKYDFSTQTPEHACDEVGCSPEDLVLFEAGIEEVITTGEVDAQCPAGICVGSYIYITDDVSRTYSEAEAICTEFYGLATIETEAEFECARNLISGPAAWIGLQSLDNDDSIFKYLDGTDCPTEYNNKHFDGCVPSPWWQYQKQNGRKHRPRCYHNHSNENGSKCVNIDNKYIDNDIHCDRTLLAVLCNGKPRLISAKHDKMMYIENNPSNNNPLGSVIYGEYYQYIIFGSIILFIMINNVFICIWCLRKTSSAHTTYNKVQIEENQQA